MRKKVISAFVACCLLNTVLYAPVFAVEADAQRLPCSPVNLMGKNNDPGTALLDGDILSILMRFQTIKGDGASLKSFNNSARRIFSQNPCLLNGEKFNQVEPLIAIFQRLKEADAQTLLLEAQCMIDRCIVGIDRYTDSAANTLVSHFFKSALLTIRQRLEQHDEILSSIQDGTQPGQWLDTKRNTVMELLVCLTTLTCAIGVYGIETYWPDASRPVTAYQIYLVSYSILLSCMLVDDDPYNLRFIKSVATVYMYAALTVFYESVFEVKYKNVRNELLLLELVSRIVAYSL